MKGLLTVLMLAGAMALAPAAAAQPAASGTKPIFDGPHLLAKAMLWVEDFGHDEGGEPTDGLYPQLGDMITGAGWISGGPGYRRHIFRGTALVDVSAAISWRAYKIAQGTLEFSHLANNRLSVGSKVLWHDFTQVRYFGLGPHTLEGGVSDFRLRATDAVGYATWHLPSSLFLTGTVGWLGRPLVSSSTGSFDRGEPDTLTLYGSDPGAALSRQPQFVHGELAIAADRRDHPSYPRRSAIVRGAWSTYRDRSTSRFTFTRYEGEAACFLPIGGRGVVAARFWGIFTDTAAGRDVPFYLMPSLGGHNTLRGYADYRFHDRNSVVANIESRWALFQHLDGALFFDAGGVAARAEDLTFDRTSYGFGVRLHTNKTTVARFDVGRSQEGWRFLLKLSDPLRLGRLTKRTAQLPFVP